MQPLNIKPWQAIVAILGLIGSIAGSMTIINSLYLWAAPKGDWFNSRFGVLLLGVLLVVGALLMNQLWRMEYEKRTKAEWDAENYRQRLTYSEQQRMMDFPTGLPNGDQLKADLLAFYSEHLQAKAVQVALIDIRNFKKVNSLAQHIQGTMRRNEYIYKHPEDRPQQMAAGAYRRYKGGDEFVLLIEGDQAEALGFINRLQRTFKELTPQTKDWLGREVPLGFICSLVPFERSDTPDRVLEKLGQCYTVAAHSDDLFSICWFDESAKSRITDPKDRRHDIYANTSKLFDVRKLN